MQIASFSVLFGSGEIHPTEQKLHFAFVDPEEEKHPEQETQVESGNLAYSPGLDRKNMKVMRNYQLV